MFSTVMNTFLSFSRMSSYGAEHLVYIRLDLIESFTDSSITTTTGREYTGLKDVIETICKEVPK